MSVTPFQQAQQTALSASQSVRPYGNDIHEHRESMAASQLDICNTLQHLATGLQALQQDVAEIKQAVNR